MGATSRKPGVPYTMPSAPSRPTAARSTGRPSLERAAEISDAIVGATINLFSEQGMEFSMDRVAALAGISKQAIYRRWPGKIDLLIHAIERGIEIENATLPAALPPDPLAALRELTWRRFNDGRNIRYRASIFLQAEAMRNERLHERALEWSTEHVALIARHVEVVIGGDGRKPTSHDLAQILLDLIDSAGAIIAVYGLPPALANEMFDQRWAAFTAILKNR